MVRRHFLGLLVSSLLMTPLSAFAENKTVENKTLEFEPGALQTQLDAGKTVFLDYYTHWCSTCKRQARVIEALRLENPAYNKAIVFMDVNWTVYENFPISTTRNIPRRSTLLMLKGDQELGRIVSGTSKEDIKALMDKAL